MLKRFSALMLSALMTISGFGAVNIMAQDKAKIFIAGDSTACIYGSDDNYSVRREGWGMALPYMIYEDKAEVVDLAMSGRSSKSFTVEENYQTLLNDMGKGDYLIIQFGHNDAKKSSPEDLANRYTSDEGDKDTDGSFKNSLYKNYILKAQEKGATPILITPVSRNDFDENGICKDTHGNYDDCIRELAEECGVSCVDLTKLTSDLYTSLGKTQTSMLHAIYKDPEKGSYGHDDTHFNKYGALTIAELARNELLKIDGIKELLRPSKNYIQSFTKDYTITRADYATTMARILKADPVENADNVFNDVKSDNANAGYLQAAKDLGIIKGDDKGNFNPDLPLKFGDLALMTYRTMETTNFSTFDYSDELALSTSVLKEEFKGAIVDDVKNDELIDMASAFSMYVNVYDLVTDSSNVEKVQTADEIEKVE